MFGEWFDIFWFHSCYFHGLSKTITDKLGYGLSQVVAEQDGVVQRFYFSRSEWSAIGKRYLQEVIQEPRKLKKLLAEVRLTSDKLVVFKKKLRHAPVDNISVAKQMKFLGQYHVLHHQVWAVGQVPNVLELENSLLSDYLKLWLSHQNISETEKLTAFQTLATPRGFSAAQKEEREMLALAIKENPIRQLNKHWQKYSWLYFGWTGPSLTLRYFVDVHKGLRKEGKAEEKLRIIKRNDRILIKGKSEWLDSLDAPKEIRTLFGLLEELLFMKTYRMDALFMSYEAVQPLLKKIADTHYLSLQQVYATYYDWLAAMVKKDKVDTNKINEIAKYSVQYFDGEKVYLLMGDKAKEIVQKVRAKLPKSKEVTELKGQCAYPGKVQGRVSIVNRAEEMVKFANGDVLVANVTDPSLLPIMKKASAFVTNMGGLTCHAAIVARELRIPCVVGTKIATHVFKDGDMVEVDADKGIVRKL